MPPTAHNPPELGFVEDLHPTLKQQSADPVCLFELAASLGVQPLREKRMNALLVVNVCHISMCSGVAMRGTCRSCGNYRQLLRSCCKALLHV
mmetsp:Transcript_48637/g.103742  ORF Transcript_48637/g.103742 Transcript_48637/m.103742 type:complete len:92 (-) Transcript_48637:164-439(-)